MNRCGPTRRYLATGDDYEYIAEMSEDLNIYKREIIIEADAETLARMIGDSEIHREITLIVP